MRIHLACSRCAEMDSSTTEVRERRTVTAPTSPRNRPFAVTGHCIPTRREANWSVVSQELRPSMNDFRCVAMATCTTCRPTMRNTCMWYWCYHRFSWCSDRKSETPWLWKSHSLIHFFKTTANLQIKAYVNQTIWTYSFAWSQLMIYLTYCKIYWVGAWVWAISNFQWH